MQVQYENEPESYESTSRSDSGSSYQSTGVRFKWTFSVDETTNTYVANCIRWKNFSTNGERYNGEIFLKIVEYEPSEYDEYGYAKLGEKILSVSSNSINQYKRNEENEWYEWYFPKQIQFKRNHVYVIIPHHDKSYECVTESDSKFLIYGTSDIHTGQKNIIGIWTDTRQENTNESRNPIIQFCKKTPTTILMKQ